LKNKRWGTLKEIYGFIMGPPSNCSERKEMAETHLLIYFKIPF
jgi:hypothetical protein